MAELLCARCQTQVAIGRKHNLSGRWPASLPHLFLTFLWTGFEMHVSVQEEILSSDLLLAYGATLVRGAVWAV